MDSNRGVSSGRRFLVYFVDFFIVGVVTSLVMLLVELILKNIITNYVPYDTAYNTFYNAYLNYLLGKINDETLYQYISATLPSILTYLGIQQVLNFIIMAIYFVVIPICNKKHLTLGRLLCKTKVISLKYGDMRKQDIIVRELLSYLFYQLVPIAGFISAIFAIAKGDSLVDIASKTRMIYDDPNFVNNNDSNNNDYSKNDNSFNDDYIDAKVNVVDDNVNNYNTNNNSDNNLNNNDSNDEYRTF